MGELRIYIKQEQQYDLKQAHVYYDGPNPQSLQMKYGALAPTPRQWRNYGDYLDVTHEVGNLQSLSLTWSQDRDASGVSTPGALQSKRSASGMLQVEGEAYRLMKQWLIEDVSAPLNAVSVKIYDSGCGCYYEDYRVAPKDIRYCENEVCSFDFTIKQTDERLNCIKSTLIHDNWQHWFQPQPVGKMHPRFSYCNEIRPNGILVAIWMLGMMNFVLTNSILIPISLIINAIIFAINGIIAIIRFLGGTPDYIKFIDLKDIIDTQEQSFVESAGCGREHPAPLIRDYITNVCDRCGVHVDQASAPIFFAQDIAVETSSRGRIVTKNPHYNACYFYAPVQRGIRRVSLPSPFREPDFNNTDFWIPDNSPLHTLDTFLDELKVLYNAEWKVQDGVLYFNRKDYFLDGDPVFDFSVNGGDRDKIIEGVCFEWNETKYPAATRGLYTADAIDTCGNEARKHTDGIVEHGKTDENPNFEGIREIYTGFGAAKFRCDGASTDYIYDAMQVNVNFGIITTFSGTIMRNVGEELQKYSDYALLLKDDTCSQPKVIIWDGESYLHAKAFTKKFAYTPYGNNPVINPAYNKDMKNWDDLHEINQFVKGSNLNPWSFPKGAYTCKNILGLLVMRNEAKLVNYPMYMAPEFEDGMWDWFHWIDDPRRNPVMNQNWSLKMELCCDDVDRLEVTGDANGIVLGRKVRLPAKYYSDGRIKEITVSYDPKNERGAYIELKGTN